MSAPLSPLRYLVDVRVSNVDKKSKEDERGVRLCNYTDVYYNDVITADRDYMVATASADQISRFRLREGDTVITKDSETASDIAVSAYVAQGADDLVCGYHLAVLRPRLAKVDPRFLSWAIRSEFCHDQFAVNATGVTRYGLKQDAILGVQVPVPRAEEQRRIADFLDDQVARIDEIIRLREEQMVAMEDRFALTLHQCFDSSQAPSVPLRRVVAGLQTGSTPTVDDVQPGDDTIGWYTPNSFGPLAMLNGPMKQFPSTLKRADGIVRFQAPAVLFVGIGWASGRVAYLDRPGSGNQQLTAIYPNELIRPRFLLWQLHHAGPHIRRIAPFTVLPVLSNDFLRSVPIVLPDLAAQDNSLALIERQSELLLQMRTEAAAQIGLLASRRRSLITAAVTGEFDVSLASGREVVAG